MFNWVVEEGRLSVSMMESIIIVLPKEAKSTHLTHPPINQYFYVKIMVRAARLKKKEKRKKRIKKCIHHDQSAYIPNR